MATALISDAVPNVGPRTPDVMIDQEKLDAVDKDAKP